MLQAKGFDAWVTIDGVEAPEYNVEVSENQQEVNCWIPSEVGKKFVVHWTNNSVPGLTGGGVQVDGHKCGFEAIASETRPISLFMDGIAEAETQTRPFVFTPLELTDDDAYLESALHPQLGLIKLEIWRVDIGGGIAPSTIAVPAAQKVHERAKKGMNQHVQFGDAIQHAQVQSAQIRRVGMGPLVTFSFKYRSLELLRANGIAPPPERAQKRKASEPPQTESASTDQEAGSDAQEAARLRQRLDTLTSKRAKKNPEALNTEPATQENESSTVNIKAEPSETSLKPE
ncbi:hypothetical protein DFH08DRAFT_738811 [Mycena albidolilacea]|uniref:DUF7918 domain-containing protein n=1 Tax=Mycena albidolilacea TaxID=1033008 RepID=A0AAD7EYM6_9AGAR|nr:hypothetical protein DFH08DRAFT_738811 [Mycena albidolilacea]